MARQLLRKLGTRYGVALLLAILLVGIVSIARAVNGPRDAPTASSIATPAPADASQSIPDDGLTAEDQTPKPSTSPGASAPDGVALDFAHAWAQHTGVTPEQWRRRLARYATAALMKRLADTDPAAVPADRVIGQPQLETIDSSLIGAAINMDSGTLRLRMILQNGRWVVDGVDWERP